MAVHNATDRGTLLIARGRRYEVLYRYESWVQLWSRPVRPRVDLAPLAALLDGVEGHGASWEADTPSGLTAGLRLVGGAESSLDLATFRGLVEEHLRTAPPAWDPYPADEAVPAGA